MKIIKNALAIETDCYNFDNNRNTEMKTSHPSPLPKTSSRGFSLFEMLMVIAIMGVIAAMVIPNVSGSILNGAHEAHVRRNAQEIVGLAMSAQAAGAEVIVEGNIRSTIQNLFDGVSPNDGPFRDRTFRMDNPLSEKDLDAVMPFLAIENGELLYTTPEGGYNL